MWSECASWNGLVDVAPCSNLKCGGGRARDAAQVRACSGPNVSSAVSQYSQRFDLEGAGRSGPFWSGEVPTSPPRERRHSHRKDQRARGRPAPPGGGSLSERAGPSSPRLSSRIEAPGSPLQRRTRSAVKGARGGLRWEAPSLPCSSTTPGSAPELRPSGASRSQAREARVEGARRLRASSTSTTSPDVAAKVGLSRHDVRFGHEPEGGSSASAPGSAGHKGSHSPSPWGAEHQSHRGYERALRVFIDEAAGQESRA